MTNMKYTWNHNLNLNWSDEKKCPSQECQILIPHNNCAFEMTQDPSKGILATKKRQWFRKGLAWSSQAQQNWSGSSFGGKRFWLRRVGSARWTPVGPEPRAAKRAPGGQKPTKHPNPGRPLGPLPCLLFLFFVSVELLRPSECHKLGCKCLFWPTSLYRSWRFSSRYLNFNPLL